MKSKGSEPVSRSALAIALVSVLFGLFFCSYSFYLHTELPAAKSLKCTQADKTDSLPSFESLASETETTKNDYYKCNSDLQTARQMTGDQESKIKDLKAQTETQDNKEKGLLAEIDTKKHQGFKACGKGLDKLISPSTSDKLKKKIVELHPELNNGYTTLISDFYDICTLQDDRVVVLLSDYFPGSLHMMLFAKDGGLIAETLEDSFKCHSVNGGYWASFTDLETPSTLHLECNGSDEGSGYQAYYEINLLNLKDGIFNKVVETKSCDTYITFQ